MLPQQQVAYKSGISGYLSYPQGFNVNDSLQVATLCSLQYMYINKDSTIKQASL